jgi:phage shock protein PspC (stress-responsive transcriptional regulator)
MKKVININFQGRVIPIEETAHTKLQQYVESLRRFFANEEGRDEIINDIETRIAELFADILKKGATCITDENVESVITSMGRPEDFEGEEAKVESQLKGEKADTNDSGEYKRYKPAGRLYRDSRDKILGGVCAGIASYLKLDPSIVRILFALITIGGFGAGFLLYIILWVVLPKTPLSHDQVKSRLYRNPDDKVIGGVAGGIAAYFDIAVWIPRFIFALPLIISAAGAILSHASWPFHNFNNIITSSFGSTFFIVYAILWAVVPEARSASEKLEMRGKKIDLNSIKTSVQEEIDGITERSGKWGKDVKEKSEKWSKEVKEKFGKEWSDDVNRRATEWGNEFAERTRNAGAEFSRKGGRRFFHAIGVIFKAIFLFFSSLLAFGLLLLLLGLIFGDGADIISLKNYFIESQFQNTLFWISLILLFTLPIIGLLTWIIRRIAGIKKGAAYIGYSLSGLWAIGFITTSILAVSVAKNYRKRSGVTTEVSIAQPSAGKLIIKKTADAYKVYDNDWWDIHWDNRDGAFFDVNSDSLTIRSAEVNIVKSRDNLYHIQYIKLSHGSTFKAARESAASISFPITQNDSIVYLPEGIHITVAQKFRAQQIVVLIEVPEGKKIEMDESVGYRSYDNSSERLRRTWGVEWNENWNRYQDWDNSREYIMNPEGLRSTRHRQEEEEQTETNENVDEKLEDYKRSKKELEKRKEQKLKELQELNKALDAPVDSTGVRKKTYLEPKNADKKDLTAQKLNEAIPDSSIHNWGWVSGKPVI